MRKIMKTEGAVRRMGYGLSLIHISEIQFAVTVEVALRVKSQFFNGVFYTYSRFGHFFEYPPVLLFQGCWHRALPFPLLPRAQRRPRQRIPPMTDVYKRQAFDSIREEYTTMLQNQLARGNNGLIKTKYLTFGIDADSIKAAKPRLAVSYTHLDVYKRQLLDRSTLSQKNGWQDSEGRTYIVYPIAEIAEMLDKGCTTIKGALNELDAAGLLERRRAGFSCANRLYVKVPDIPVVQFFDQLTDGKPPLIRAGNRPTDSRKTDLMTVGKPSPNQTNINNLIESQTKRASEGPVSYTHLGNTTDRPSIPSR